MMKSESGGLKRDSLKRVHCIHIVPSFFLISRRVHVVAISSPPKNLLIPEKYM